ncbi:MAG: hypothetical protein LBQ27_00765 [Clostridiales bacterium]|jgi:hypothetical protein|nr:hypothetical protein [Clostridiales bacterium]
MYKKTVFSSILLSLGYLVLTVGALAVALVGFLLAQPDVLTIDGEIWGKIQSALVAALGDLSGWILFGIGIGLAAFTFISAIIGFIVAGKAKKSSGKGLAILFVIINFIFIAIPVGGIVTTIINGGDLAGITIPAIEAAVVLLLNIFIIFDIAKK